MGIYWRLESIPEFKGLSSAQLRSLFWQANKRLRKTRIVWAVVLVLLQCINPLVLMLTHFHWPYAATVTCIVLGLTLCWGALLPPMTIAKARPYMRQMLGLCPNCGYDLRATPDRCPECGTIPSITPAGK